MRPCKYCGEEIEWREDPNTGRGFWANPTTGQRHSCPGEPKTVKQEIVNPVSHPNNPAPADGLKTVEGQIVGIDYDKRLIRIKDITGESTLIVWTENRDEVFKKQKQWWFVRLTGEFVDHSFIPYDVSFWEKPANWPKTGGKGGNYQPRNEKPIIYQVCFKEACETARHLWTIDPSGGEFEEVAEFNRLMDMALERAKHDAEELIKASGVQ